MGLALLPLAFIVIPIRAVKMALPVVQIIFPLSIVDVASDHLQHAVALPLVLEVLAFVNSPVLVVLDTGPVPLVLLPGAYVPRARG